MEDELKLFVYGSLKLGECNDDVISAWVVEALPASIAGQMYLRPDGYPALWLEGTFALGTADYSADLARCLEPIAGSGGGVQGQLLRLREGRRMLERLDEFEGYFPGQSSEYARLLVPVATPEGVCAAWTYACPEGGPRPRWVGIDCWPPPGSEKPAPYRVPPR